MVGLAIVSVYSSLVEGRSAAVISAASRPEM
jgi:hypothetical protein